jgi:hypothetical protein
MDPLNIFPEKTKSNSKRWSYTVLGNGIKTAGTAICQVKLIKDLFQGPKLITLSDRIILLLTK